MAGNGDWYTDPSFTSARKRAQKGHDVLDYLPHHVQRKSFNTPGRDSTTGDVKASVFCNVSARSRHFVNVNVIFLPSVCDSFCVSTFSFGQGCRSFCHALYEQSTVVFCRSGLDACFTIVCILCADHVFWYPWLGVCVVERIVARSVLSPEFSMFSASVCVAPFFSNPCLQGWVFLSCTWEHESRVFEPVLRCCVTRA